MFIIFDDVIEYRDLGEEYVFCYFILWLSKNIIRMNVIGDLTKIAFTIYSNFIKEGGVEALNKLRDKLFQ